VAGGANIAMVINASRVGLVVLFIDGDLPSLAVA
jgi:hypothetical protein